MTPQRPESPDLARAQAALLEILAAGGSGAELADRIRHSEATTYQAAAHQYDPALLEIAAALTQTWGRRQAGPI